MKFGYLMVVVLSVVTVGCAPVSKWKLQGGPATCEKMCADWGLDFTAMVGVGNQDKRGEGATACVCQPKDTRRSSIEGASGSSTSLAAPVVAAQQAAAAAAQASANAAAAAQAANLIMMQRQQYQPPK